MSQLEVVLVGSMDYYFDPVAAAVAAKGYKAVRYRMPADFLANKAALANAAVLYAVGYCPVSRETLEHAPHLRAVISPWTGTEGFDEKAATELGILVGNGAIPEIAENMAEATILMLLACLYDVNKTQQRLRDHVWAQPILTAQMLKGKSLGLFGYGAIAKGIVQRLAGWGVNISVTTRYPLSDVNDVNFLPLDDMLAASDVVCILTPLIDETRGLFDRARLSKMKRGSVLICTSRGGIIDEAALYDLAKEGHFSAIGLDVYQTEPLPPESPLLELSNAFLTPHSIGLTQPARVRLIELGVEQVLGVLEGQPPLYIRNPEALATWRGKSGAAKN